MLNTLKSIFKVATASKAKSNVSKTKKLSNQKVYETSKVSASKFSKKKYSKNANDKGISKSKSKSEPVYVWKVKQPSAVKVSGPDEQFSYSLATIPKIDAKPVGDQILKTYSYYDPKGILKTTQAWVPNSN